MKRILPFLLILISSPFFGQTYQTWRSEASNNIWQTNGNWWNFPNGSPIVFGQQEWDNNHFTSQSSNADVSTWRFLFKAGATTAHTFSGNKVRFFDFSGQNPSITNSSSATHIINNNIEGDGDLADPLEILVFDGNLTFNGAINNFGSWLDLYGNSGRNMIFSGAISGNGGLTVKQNITATLSNSNNTYAGATSVEAGTLIVQKGGHSASITTGQITFTFASTTQAAGTYNFLPGQLTGSTTRSLNSNLVGSKSVSFNYTTGSVIICDLSVAPSSISGTNTICSGSSTTLTQTGGTLGTNAIYRWYSGSCGGTLVGTGDSVTVSPTITTTYYVRAEGLCNTTSCAAITVTVNPLTTNGSVTTSICQGQSYTWPANGQTYATAQTNLTEVVGCNTATLNLSITPLTTPTVSLTSSDGDNTFAYGTSVTFTATAGNLGGGTASYDFKVNGSSVQNGASSSFVSSNLGNGNQVSVSITVSGGTCMSSTTANSTVITNTVTGAYLSNIICVPTLPVINRIIRATVPSGVSGVLGYRFKVRNNSTNTTVTLDRNVANFNLTMTSIYTYNTSFDVQVAAVVDGVEQPYSAVCVVTTPSIPLNQVGVGGVQCGGTLESLNTRIFANTVFGSQLYRFRVALSTAPTTYYYTTSVFPSFRLTGVAGLPLTYGTSYLVSVQSEVDVNGTLTISEYSTACTVSTPAVTAIVPSSAGQCGQTLETINQRIFINSVPNANQYTYRLALASAPTVYYDFTSSFTNFRLTSVVGLPLTFETDYLLSVQARVTIEGQNYFSSFSTPCPVRTPNFLTVGLQASQCSNDNEVTPGPYQVTSNSEIIYSELVSGASYEFVLQKVINGVPTSDAPLTLVRPVNNFTLNMVSGVTPDTSYLVFVKLNYYGQGPEGKDCSIQSPSIVASPITKITQAFTAKAYPNPFANNFLLDLSTESSSPVSIKVYDMVGRLVDSRESKASNLNSLAIGDQYPSGVYNVVVTQDEEVRTLRVVKR